MKAKTLVVLALIAILATIGVVAAGCGGGDTSPQAKAALTAALTEFELSAGALTQALAAGSDATVSAEIKGAKADIKAKWEAVLSAAKRMDWPDQEMGEKVWADVENAIDSLADTATVDGANAALTPPVDALMAVEAELWAFAQPAQ